MPSKSLLAAASLAANSRVMDSIRNLSVNASVAEWHASVNESSREGITDVPVLSKKVRQGLEMDMT